MATPTPGSWTERFDALIGTDADMLSDEELEDLAVAAYMTGHDDAAAAAWTAAFERHATADAPAAGRCAFWCAFGYMVRGQMAHASAWFTRADEIAGGLECAVQGLLRIPAALRAIDAGDAATALQLATEAEEIGRRHDDGDLLAFAVLAQGQALLADAQLDEGMARLDRVMLAVTAGNAGPISSGIVYCAVVLECMDALDFARASEWTSALDEWCSSQPGLVPYRGQCLVHQSQLQQAAGEWDSAVDTVRSARERLSDPPHPALGLAHYQEAELLRLTGDLDAATETYRKATECGHPAMPGLALLDRDRGRVDDALSRIRRGLAEATRDAVRAPLLAAAVEIALAAGEVNEAEAAAAELARIAEHLSTPFLLALEQLAGAEVDLARGDAAAALRAARTASARWRELGMPFQIARTAVVAGRCCLALGDRASAALEFEAARDHLTQLGARPELDRIPGVGDEPTPAGLSAREIEVLVEVARGRTNREIAEALHISQHTVGRHLENIFAKLGVTSRAAATTFAHRHGLL